MTRFIILSCVLCIAISSVATTMAPNVSGNDMYFENSGSGSSEYDDEDLSSGESDMNSTILTENMESTSNASDGTDEYNTQVTTFPNDVTTDFTLTPNNNYSTLSDNRSPETTNPTDTQTSTTPTETSISIKTPTQTSAQMIQLINTPTPTELPNTESPSLTTEAVTSMKTYILTSREYSSKSSEDIKSENITSTSNTVYKTSDTDVFTYQTTNASPTTISTETSVPTTPDTKSLDSNKVTDSVTGTNSTMVTNNSSATIHASTPISHTSTVVYITPHNITLPDTSTVSIAPHNITSFDTSTVSTIPHVTPSDYNHNITNHNVTLYDYDYKNLQTTSSVSVSDLYISTTIQTTPLFTPVPCISNYTQDINTSLALSSFDHVTFTRVDCPTDIAAFDKGLVIDSGLGASLFITIYKRLNLVTKMLRLVEELNEYTYTPADFVQ
ncbi:b116.1 [Murid betaherpesvirus 8]|uniref:B116.1 n=1 Tax=Rat cytomegalovirus (isolate England) TaxID=1261657 RepID=A0A0E3SWV0_RCMVE|nr:b116.1 [Murid betaherpesvirus 8]WPH25018.1 b116.1 [Murid betaherpesvirus 8]WPH25152.1 b116.1 [Murid betaherpesvirus 8]